MSKELERRLGLWDLVFIVMGAIVGVGIFFSPGRVAGIAGSEAVAIGAWLLGGAIGLAGALTFAELGGLFPRTGGQYHVLRQAFGRPLAFLYGWSLLTVIQSGAIGIVSLICVNHLAELAGLRLGPSTGRIAAAVMIAGLVYANIRGVTIGAWLNNVAMITKLAILGGIAVLALAFDGPEARAATAADGAADWTKLLPALIPVLFAAGGWQQALYVAGEVKNPSRFIPLGIVGGVLGVVILYLLVNLGCLNVLDVDVLGRSETPVADVVGAAAGPLWRRLASLGVAISAFGVAHVCILTAPRMYKAMADDGCFWKPIAAVHPRHRTPALALTVQGGVAVALVLVAGPTGVDKLLTGVVCIDCLFFMATGIALFVLRRKMPGAERPYRTTGYPIVPLLFVVAEGAALAGAFMNPDTVRASYIAVVVLLAGVAAYAFFRNGVVNAASATRE